MRVDLQLHDKSESREGPSPPESYRDPCSIRIPPAGCHWSSVQINPASHAQNAAQFMCSYRWCRTFKKMMSGFSCANLHSFGYSALHAPHHLLHTHAPNIHKFRYVWGGQPDRSFSLATLANHNEQCLPRVKVANHEVVSSRR